MRELKPSPPISVNIPIYNGEKTIARAVKSILEQSFTDFELIVINDCSNDSTAQILNTFSDRRMKVIHHDQNQGISRTRNHLLRSSIGNYVAVLDGDDFALPHRLKTQFEAMRSEASLDGVFSSTRSYSGQDPYETLPGSCSGKEPSRMRETLLFESVCPHSTAFLSRQAFGHGYNEDLSCAEDYAKWLELAFAGKMLRTLRSPVSHTWRHAPSSYTREKMRLNVMNIQASYFKRLFGRALSETEMNAQWTLYETLEWNPSSRSEALEQLESIQKWISAIRHAEFTDKSIDQDRFHLEAQRRLYQLCSKATLLFGFRTSRFTRDMPFHRRLKLLVKGLFFKANS